jgi:hypothetical protein
MRRLAVGIPAALATLAVAVPAVAAGSFPPVTVSPKVTPDKAGTTAKPQGVKLHVQLTWKSLGAANQPIVTNFKVLFPQGSLYNGGSTPSCPFARINVGPSACPAASIVGRGTGVAYADQTRTHPTITVVNGGGTKVYFYTVLNNPAHVAEPIVGHIAKLGGKWAYSLTATVPQNLRIVAGVPIELTSLTIDAGKGDWLATTKCGPGNKWPFSVTTGFVNPNSGAHGSSDDADSIACRS